MAEQEIAIIGAGNMGSAIARGLLRANAVKPSLIHVTDKDPGVLPTLAHLGIKTSTSNPAAVNGAVMVILAVKPHLVHQVLGEIKGILAPGTLIVSLAAGITCESLVNGTGGGHAVFRVMPNTAIAIGQSMTCISSANSTAHQVESVKYLFGKLGQVIEIPEDLMPAATVLASCGTAFALKYMRAATQGGVQMGFSNEVALKMVAQTVIGAAHLVAHHNSHPEQEIDRVTTPGGITIAGLNQMEHEGFSSSVIKGLMASFQKMGKG